jgi:hypothetical protein
LAFESAVFGFAARGFGERSTPRAEAAMRDSDARRGASTVAAAAWSRFTAVRR